MKNKTIYILLGLTVIGLIVLFVIKKKEKQKLIAAQNAAPTQPLQAPALATQPYNGATQPVFAPPVYDGANGSHVNQIGLIKIVQAAFGLKIDGVLGAKTQAAIQGNGIDLSSPQKFVDKLVTMKDPAIYARYFPMKKGSKSNYVKALQLFLNLKPDGVFGAGTEAACVTVVGTNIIYHKQYCELFSTYTGITVSYNGKELTVSEKVKKWFMGLPAPKISLF